MCYNTEMHFKACIVMMDIENHLNKLPVESKDMNSSIVKNS